MYKFLPIYVMCIAIYGTNNHERTMEIVYKLENKLHNRNCCKFARTIAGNRLGNLNWYILKWKTCIINLKISMGCFIYILDSSNSSSITFWTSQFGSSSRSNWTGIWTGNSNGSWTDKQSSHFSTAKEIRVKAKFFFT